MVLSFTKRRLTASCMSKLNVTLFSRFLVSIVITVSLVIPEISNLRSVSPLEISTILISLSLAMLSKTYPSSRVTVSVNTSSASASNLLFEVVTSSPSSSTLNVKFSPLTKTSFWLTPLVANIYIGDGLASILKVTVALPSFSSKSMLTLVPSAEL